MSAAALIIYDARNGIGRIRTYILYNNFQGLINVYYLPRNAMASRPHFSEVVIKNNTVTFQRELLQRVPANPPLAPARDIIASRIFNVGVIARECALTAGPAEK